MEGERGPQPRDFLILHFNRFQKAPWRNANRLKCQNREGVSSRSADLILFSALIFFFGGEERGRERGRGREGVESAHARGFGEGRAVQSAAAPARAKRGARPGPRFYRNPF